MAAKPKKIIRTTPVGRFVWPKFAKPDEYKGKKSYNCKFALPADHEWAQKFIAAIDKMADETLAKAVSEDKRVPAKQKKDPWGLARKPYENELDKEGEETGNVVFKFKANYSGTRKDGSTWVRDKLRVFDAKGKPFKLADDPWNGSEGCVSFEMRPFAQGPDVGAGVSLSIEAVQITKLVSGGEGSADQYGFGAHEDGFDADDIQADDKTADDKGNASDVAEASDDDDF
jgi:hypothetical protein